MTDSERDEVLEILSEVWETLSHTNSDDERKNMQNAIQSAVDIIRY